MQIDVPGPELADFLDLGQRRAALRQLEDGINDSELCTPCQIAADHGDFRRIGTAAWLNQGFENCKHLDRPLSYCCLCRHVLRARELARKRGMVDITPNNVEFDSVVTNLEPRVFCHDDGFDLDGANAGLVEGFEVEKCQNTRSIRRDLVDINRIRGWLNECEGRHDAEGCNAHRDKDNIEPSNLLLIDVQNDCLVQGHFSDRFFALSYVWGLSRQFLTLQHNYQSLLKKGSISALPITQTVRDSMTLVKSLGEQYLWVDTMCIIQDDVNNKATAIAQMSSIYSCTVATIICLNGSSANAGLSGISPTVRNTSAVYIAPGLSVIPRPTLKLSSDEIEYIYRTRAWTFQEQMLSNRNIIFLREQVYFQCKKELLSEDSYIDNIADKNDVHAFEFARVASNRNNMKNKWYSPLEDFLWYETFIPDYTGRQLGYRADIINAFTGIQTELGKLFGWTFVEGLPVQLLDIALLWTPLGPIERRVTDPPHPSWSWSGWIGPVHHKELVHLSGPGQVQIGQNFRSAGNLKINTDSPDTLHYRGETVALDAFTLRQSESQLHNLRANLSITPNPHFLFDRKGRRCGILYGLQETLDAHDLQRGFVLLHLSEWQSTLQDLYYHGPFIFYSVEDGYERREQLFDKGFEIDAWSTLNVMCVQWSGTGKECHRVAVGQIHKNAWKEAGFVSRRLLVK